MTLPPLQTPAPLTKLSSFTSSSASTESVFEPAVDKISRNRQMHLKAMSFRTQAQVMKTLTNVLVKELRPLKPELRQVLLSQARQSEAGNQVLTRLLAENDLFLLKLNVNDKTQWALSPWKITAGSELKLTIDQLNVWRVQEQSQKSLPQNKILRQAIRESLPKAVNLSSAFRFFRQLGGPLSRQSLDIPQALQQAIIRVQQLAPTPAQLSQAKLVETIIQQSGGVYEHKIASIYQLLQRANKVPKSIADWAIPKKSAIGAKNTNANGTIIRTMQGGSTGNKQHLQQSIPGTRRAIKSQNIPPSPVDDRLGKDIKAQLIIVKQIADSFLQPIQPQAKSLASAMPTPLSPVLNRTQLGPTMEKSRRSAINSQQQVIQQIKQQAIAAIAKIQLHQAQTMLKPHLQQTDNSNPITLLQLEIPVRIENDFHKLQLQIDQDWLDRNRDSGSNNSKNRQREKVKRWRVTLSFDLPNAGGFYARITHIEESTQVQFWADQQQTLTQARKKLDQLKCQLQSQGINVTEIHCARGRPLQNHNPVEYSLVDVNT